MNSFSIPTARFVRSALTLGALSLAAALTACSDEPTGPSDRSAAPRPRSNSQVMMSGLLELTPQDLSFDGQLVGTTSPPKAIRVHNISGSQLTLTSISIGGANAADYGIDLDTSKPCEANVAIPADSSCDVLVAFTPSEMGIRLAELSLAYAGGSASALLEGLGTRSADLGVSLTASVQAVRTVAYSVTVKNGGPGDATSITINDVLPAGTTFVGIAGSQDLTCTTPGVGNAGTVTCSTAYMPNGAASTLQITVKAGPGSKNSLTNTVTVSSVSYDGLSGNNKATVTTSLNGKR